MNNLNDIFFAPAANQDLTYEQILEDVQRYFAENHAATIAEAGDGNTDRASSLLKELMVLEKPGRKQWNREYQRVRRSCGKPALFSQNPSEGCPIESSHA